MLINNAGAFFGKVRETTKDGLEKTISAMHKRGGKPDFSDLQSEKNYAPSRAYGLSKLYVIWITRYLATELKEKGINNITANVLHPGAVATQFGQNVDKGFITNLIFKMALSFMDNIEKGTSTTVYLATSEEVENVTGKFFGNMKEEKVDDRYYSKENEKIVWDYCRQIIAPYLDK